MGDIVIYDTGNSWRPCLILRENVVEFDKFKPYAKYTNGVMDMVYYESDPELERLLIQAIKNRMAEIGVDPDDKYKTVIFSKEGIPSFRAKTIQDFINGSLRTYVYNHWVSSFEDLLNVIKIMPAQRFCINADTWNPNEFILTVNRPKFRREVGNKNTKTFDFIDIEMVVRSTDATKEKVKANKDEIFKKAIEKLETSKRFQKYGVPVNFLKMYQFVVRKDGTLIISFCMKGEIRGEIRGERS